MRATQGNRDRAVKALTLSIQCKHNFFFSVSASTSFLWDRVSVRGYATKNKPQTRGPICNQAMTSFYSCNGKNDSITCVNRTNADINAKSKQKVEKLHRENPIKHQAPTPQQIFGGLNKYVIGQEEVKKVLAVAVHNHYKTVFFNNIIRDKQGLTDYLKNASEKGSSARKHDESPSSYEDRILSDTNKAIGEPDDEVFDQEESWRDFETSLETKDEATLKKVLCLSEQHDIDMSGLNKSNILLLGPTGSGKTLIAQTLAKIAGVPLVIFDATTLTQAGYVGDDVENILVSLYQASDEDLKRAEKGIVYIDEIDKLSRVSAPGAGAQRDVSGEGVQQALLKILEGSVCNIPTKFGAKARAGETIKFNTKNVLFICGGAFAGLDQVIARRSSMKGIGFGAPVGASSEEKKMDMLPKVETKDLVSYGLIPEFVGRFTHVVATSELSCDQLISILVEPKNSVVKQYRALFGLENVQFTVEKEALEAIASAAHSRGTGARGLKSIVDKVLTETMFHLPQKPEVTEIILTKESIEGGVPKLVSSNRQEVTDSETDLASAC